MQLPLHYIDDIRGVKGVKTATYANWFGGKDPKRRTEFFATYAVDQDTFFDVMDEMKVEPDVLEAWKKTPNGAILGDLLAKTLEVKPGDRLIITSDIYMGDWEFQVVGLYQPLRKTADRNSMIFRWDYLNNDPRAAWGRDQIGYVMSRIDDSARSGEISKAIDRLFDEKDDQTVTMSERAFALSFMGAFSAVLGAFNVVSVVILLIMTLILANTIAMSVRERTHEYGVLRAIGFRPGHLLLFIVGESVLVGVVGGVLGIALTALFINGAIGPLLETNMGGLFPYFRTPAGVLLVALGLAALLGSIAAALPAFSASRLKVTEALRRLD